MQVVVKNVLIEGQSFVLVYDEQIGKGFYGTIPRSELDENGALKRRLNGFDMCIGYSIGQALANRQSQIALREFVKEGHTEQEIFAYILRSAGISE